MTALSYSPAPLRAAEILSSITYADCNVIQGRAFDADSAGAAVDVVVYIRLINDASDFATINTSGNFSVSVPSSYKDPAYETIFTAIAAPFTADQTTITQAQSLGTCGSSSGGGGSGETDPTGPINYDDSGYYGQLPTSFIPDCGVGDSECSDVDFASQNVAVQPQTADVSPIANRLIQIINFLSAGVGVVVTASVAYAGLQYITSRGVPAYIRKASQRLWQAGLALLLYLFGWALLNWLVPGGIFNQ